MMLVDSNILVYALQHTSPKKSVAQHFLVDHQAELVVAHQNILETLRILTHTKFPNSVIPKDAIESLEGIVSGLVVVYPSCETISIFWELVTKYNKSSNALFDVYLVATMLSHGIQIIVTDNQKDFSFEEISVINPFKEKYE